MTEYPEEVRLSPNKGGKILPRFIILHHSAGSHDGTLAWISQSKSGVSYHYLIDSDGSRTQMVWDQRRAWHAGVSRWKGTRGMNSHSVGIAFWGDTYERPPTAAEIDSCAEKCIYIMEKFDIPMRNILTHADVSPGRKNDCSPDTFTRVLDRIAERQVGS